MRIPLLATIPNLLPTRPTILERTMSKRVATQALLEEVVVVVARVATATTMTTVGSEIAAGDDGVSKPSWHRIATR